MLTSIHILVVAPLSVLKLGSETTSPFLREHCAVENSVPLGREHEFIRHEQYRVAARSNTRSHQKQAEVLEGALTFDLAHYISD
jgi:hypothetical protein